MLFRTPKASEMIDEQIEEAKRQHLSYSCSAEHCAALASMYEQRVQRLTKIRDSGNLTNERHQ